MRALQISTVGEQSTSSHPHSARTALTASAGKHLSTQGDSRASRAAKHMHRQCGAGLQRSALTLGPPKCAGELAAVSMSRLEAVCREQDAKWLHRLSLGIDDEEVRNLLPPAAATLSLRACQASNITSSPEVRRVQNCVCTQCCPGCKHLILPIPSAQPCWPVMQPQAV